MKKTFIHSITIILLLVLVVTSATSMLSDIYAYQAKRFELRWEKLGYISNIDEWHNANGYLFKVLRLSPSHPDYLLMSARMTLWSFFIQGEVIDDAFSRNQLSDVKAALVARPYWAEGWSYLVGLKVQLQEIDDEFWHAYQSALASGPWEPLTMNNLLDSGLLVWSQLSWRQREDVLALFYRISIFDEGVAKKSLSIVDYHGMKFAFCLMIKRSEVPTYLDHECGIA